MLDITLVSDIICPWCYVGKLRLQKAIEKVAGQDEVRLSYRPHILYPDIPEEGKEVGKASSLKQVKQELLASAEELGLSFNLRGIKRIPQTRSMHRALMNLESSQAWLMKERLFRAYFMEGVDLSDKSVLEELFHHENLPFVEIQDEKLADILSENRSNGFSAVPTFILNHDITITGAQPVDRWVNYLRKTLTKSP